MIKQESIERLKDTIDVVDVVGSYVELKKAGANYKGVCPFHSEKTPSFVVSPQKQIYHCFGCGAGGDSVKFVMEYEKLSYPETIEKLANDYNFQLEYEKTNNRSRDDYKVLDTVNHFFIKKLDTNQTALEYLRERGIYQSSIEQFQIGYAPSSQEQIQFLNSNKIPVNESIKTGVMATGDRGNLYGKFIERITFPIFSPNGKIVGFGGRTISGHQAKYVNSPQTEFFNKSRLLYAYSKAKDTIFKTNTVILTEGYLDVIMLHQAGFTNAVATLGTAMTASHLPLLKKGEPKVIVAYDGDSAGQDAALKAAKLLYKQGFSGGVVLFKEGKDPADMVKNGESNELKRLFSHPTPFSDFIPRQIAKMYDLNNASSKQQAVNEIKSYIKDLTPIFQDEISRSSASSLGVGESYFTAKNSNQQNSGVIKHNRKDILELKIIKTVLEKEEMLDTVLDYIDSLAFKTHRDLFEAVLHKQESPYLEGLLIDDSIGILEEEDLINDLKNIMTKALQEKINDVKFDSSISSQEKAFLIKKYTLEMRGAMKR
ncbi:MAG: DNA primase [Campylobacterales bacterium]|nr:DNA primase [Campylobacterales bacterium]